MTGAKQDDSTHSLVFPQCLVLVRICSMIFFGIPGVLKFICTENTLGAGWLADKMVVLLGNVGQQKMNCCNNNKSKGITRYFSYGHLPGFMHIPGIYKTCTRNSAYRIWGMRSWRQRKNSHTESWGHMWGSRKLGRQHTSRALGGRGNLASLGGKTINAQTYNNSSVGFSSPSPSFPF